MKQTKRRLAAASLCALLLLSGCGTQDTAADASDTEAVSSESLASTSVSAIDLSSLFSDRDLDPSYDESEAIAIELNGDSASCSSSAVTIDGGTITITDEGIYILSGTLTDGQIIVSAEDTDKVQLVLNGVDIKIGRAHV